MSDLPQIEVHYRFTVVDEALLRDVYRRYCEAADTWATHGLTDLAHIAEELITNLDVVGLVLGKGVGWYDLGLER